MADEGISQQAMTGKVSSFGRGRQSDEANPASGLVCHWQIDVWLLSARRRPSDVFAEGRQCLRCSGGDDIAERLLAAIVQMGAVRGPC